MDEHGNDGLAYLLRAQKYEDICMEIIEFLKIDPLKKVYDSYSSCYETVLSMACKHKLFNVIYVLTSKCNNCTSISNTNTLLPIIVQEDNVKYN